MRKFALVLIAGLMSATYPSASHASCQVVGTITTVQTYSTKAVVWIRKYALDPDIYFGFTTEAHLGLKASSAHTGMTQVIVRGDGNCDGNNHTIGEITQIIDW